MTNGTNDHENHHNNTAPAVAQVATDAIMALPAGPQSHVFDHFRESFPGVEQGRGCRGLTRRSWVERCCLVGLRRQDPGFRDFLVILTLGDALGSSDNPIYRSVNRAGEYDGNYQGNKESYNPGKKDGA